MNDIEFTPQKHALDLNRYAFKHQKGDITVYGTWYGIGDSRRPCLVLVPTHIQTSHEKITPCAVSLDDAYRWDRWTGDPAYCARCSAWFAYCLGFNPNNNATVMRITTIIHDLLGDLIHLKPEPFYEKGPITAEFVRTDVETGRQTYTEVQADV